MGAPSVGAWVSSGGSVGGVVEQGEGGGGGGGLDDRRAGIGEVGDGDGGGHPAGRQALHGGERHHEHADGVVDPALAEGRRQVVGGVDEALARLPVATALEAPAHDVGEL